MLTCIFWRALRYYFFKLDTMGLDTDQFLSAYAKLQADCMTCKNNVLAVNIQ